MELVHQIYRQPPLLLSMRRYQCLATVETALTCYVDAFWRAIRRILIPVVGENDVGACDGVFEEIMTSIDSGICLGSPSNSSFADVCDDDDVDADANAPDSHHRAHLVDA